MKKLILTIMMITVVACARDKKPELSKGQQAVLLLKYQKALLVQQQLQQAVTVYNTAVASELAVSGYPQLCADDKAEGCSRISVDMGSESIVVTVVPKKPKMKR